MTLLFSSSRGPIGTGLNRSAIALRHDIGQLEKPYQCPTQQARQAFGSVIRLHVPVESASSTTSCASEGGMFE